MKMARRLEDNIFRLSERNEDERNTIERISKLLWLSNYAPDIFVTMKESEMRRRPLRFTSTQLDQRPMLVQLCQLITRTFKLSRCTLHLGIYYMDRFIDFYTIRQDKLQLVALTCVHIAAQIESAEIFVPRYSEINRLLDDRYTLFEYKAVERKVLQFFKFELMRPTTASFVEMLACSFVTPNDYVSYCKLLDECPTAGSSYPRFYCYEQMLGTLAQLLLKMSDYTIIINKFSNDPPSLLAASCIAAARQVSGLAKRWTPYLTKLTSYTERMVEPYADVISLYHHHETTSTVKGQLQAETSCLNADSGFEESLSTPTKEVVDVEVKTIQIVSVKLQKPCIELTSLKRKLESLNAQRPSKRLKLDQERR